jgi:hypothetical protein
MISTTERVYIQEGNVDNNVFSMTVLANMTASQTASVNLDCGGGALTVDILGTNAATNNGEPTFFSGVLIL